MSTILWIGYFTSWRTGKNGAPAYLASNIPWTKITHINYAFANIGTDNRISVGPAGANNASIGIEWPGVPGAERDPSLSYQGHFNLLTKYKKQYPNVKTLISIGGWAESGGILNPDGTRNATGGFYKLAQSQASINTFTFGGNSYVIAGDLPRGGGTPPTTTSTTTSTTTTTTTTNPGGSAWAPNTYYATGAQVTYGGANYRCRQAHTSLPEWEPPNVPALWERV